MARRELKMGELEEVLYQWYKGRNISQIRNSLGLDRKTIRKYLELAHAHGFTRETELKSDVLMELVGKIQAALKSPAGYSETYKKTALYQVQIDKLLSKKYMTAKQAYRILKSDHGYLLSYSSFKCYIRIRYAKEGRSCLPLEVKAASEGQVDFGSAGQMYDPQRCQMRRAHAFVMTLSYSRLHYVEFVFEQSQSTWVKCHINAFKFFGEVPERIILDNLKSGVIKPNTYDPVMNRAYADCARHYGFIIDPAKIARGDHKGKVERKIPVVRGQFLSA
ncbi:MAG: IS21 family transposase [Nitrospirae bacterium YQR-1]